MPLPHGKSKGAAIFDKEYDWPHDEILWAAGFFEGEGGVGPRSVLISQVNRWPLEKMVLVFGGSIGSPYRGSRYRRQEIWQWMLCGDRARKFVAAIYPYLSPRRQGQIDDKFLTVEKFRAKRVIESAKQAERMRVVMASRVRGENGRFTSTRSI